MSKRIGKKVMAIVGGVAFVLLLTVISNVFALQTIKDYEAMVEDNTARYISSAKTLDYIAMAEIEEDMEWVTSKISTKIDGTLIFNVILVLVFAVIIAFAVMYVLKTISKPAKLANEQLDNIVKKINTGEGDLTARIDVKTKDEIGQLAKGINQFIENLQEIMLKLKSVSGRMLQSAETMESQVGASNDSATNVSATMEELSASMEEVAATVEQMAAGTDGIVAEVNEMTQRADEGANLVDEIKKRAGVMYSDTVRGKEETNTMVGQIREILETAVEESRTVDKINDLTGEILDIASQTNLLALNASIEAARAGEAGKGFAVVAEQIRVLADGSTQTANNIQQISGLVTNAVEKLASTADEMMKFIDKKVMKDYDGFVEVVNKYQDDADEMNEILVKFAANAADIAKNVKNISDNINGITITVDESAKGITNVAESSSNLVNAISTIYAETEANKEISMDLENQVNRFKNV